ncbi:MAG: hypothetical protein MRJ65_09055 [Candidatus Brocadiaceae bacterium]|nr:hypothetical protein [Candidatus Brocadiaceae bacterium]
MIVYNFSNAERCISGMTMAYYVSPTPFLSKALAMSLSAAGGCLSIIH